MNRHSSSVSQWLFVVLYWCLYLLVFTAGGVDGGVVRGVAEPAYVVAGRSAAEPRQAPVPAYCGPCDRRSCPLVTPESCPGRVIKDPCDCCPICDVSASAVSTPAVENLTNSCEAIQCPRRQMCVLNIQGIPLCRCPPEFFCKQQNKRKICGRNGITYKSKCYMQAEECLKNQKIRIAHEGRCVRGGEKRRQAATTTSDGDASRWSDGRTERTASRMSERTEGANVGRGVERRKSDERRAERKEERRNKRKDKNRRRRNRKRDRDERRKKRRERAEECSEDDTDSKCKRKSKHPLSDIRPRKNSSRATLGDAQSDIDSQPLSSVAILTGEVEERRTEKKSENDREKRRERRRKRKRKRKRRKKRKQRRREKKKEAEKEKDSAVFSL